MSNIEIKSDWNSIDYATGKPAFTLRMRGIDNKWHNCSFTEDCMDTEWKAYQTINVMIFELLRLSFPEGAKKEIEEMRITNKS